MQKYFLAVLRSSIELSKKRERLLGSKKCMVVQQKISRGPRLFFPSLCVPRLLVSILLSLHGASKTRKPSPCLKSLKCLIGHDQVGSRVAQMGVLEFGMLFNEWQTCPACITQWPKPHIQHSSFSFSIWYSLNKRAFSRTAL